MLEMRPAVADHQHQFARKYILFLFQVKRTVNYRNYRECHIDTLNWLDMQNSQGQAIGENNGYQEVDVV